MIAQRVPLLFIAVRDRRLRHLRFLPMRQLICDWFVSNNWSTLIDFALCHQAYSFDDLFFCPEIVLTVLQYGRSALQLFRMGQLSNDDFLALHLSHVMLEIAKTRKPSWLASSLVIPVDEFVCLFFEEALSVYRMYGDTAKSHPNKILCIKDNQSPYGSKMLLLALRVLRSILSFREIKLRCADSFPSPLIPKTIASMVIFCDNIRFDNAELENLRRLDTLALLHVLHNEEGAALRANVFGAKSLEYLVAVLANGVRESRTSSDAKAVALYYNSDVLRFMLSRASHFRFQDVPAHVYTAILDVASQSRDEKLATALLRALESIPNAVTRNTVVRYTDDVLQDALLHREDSRDFEFLIAASAPAVVSRLASSSLPALSNMMMTGDLYKLCPRWSYFPDRPPSPRFVSTTAARRAEAKRLEASAPSSVTAEQADDAAKKWRAAELMTRKGRRVAALDVFHEKTKDLFAFLNDEA